MRSTLPPNGLMSTRLKTFSITTTALLILLFFGADLFSLSHAAMDAETEKGDKVTLDVNIGRVREAPSTDANIKIKLYRGDTVSVIETKDDWYLVEIKFVKQGWAHKSLFAEKTGSEAVLNVDVGRVREMPSADSGIKFTLIRGDTVSVIEEKEDWYLIEIKYDLQGWAHQSLFTKITAPPRTC